MGAAPAAEEAAAEAEHFNGLPVTILPSTGTRWQEKVEHKMDCMVQGPDCMKIINKT